MKHESDKYKEILLSIAIKRFSIPSGHANSLADEVIRLSYGTDQIRDLRAWLIGAMCNASRHYWRTRGGDFRSNMSIGNYSTATTLRSYRPENDNRRGQFSYVPLEVPDSPQSPPTIAKFIMCIFVRRKNRSIIGDMFEEFPQNVAVYGLRRAKCLFWRDAAEAVGPSLRNVFKLIGAVGLALLSFRAFDAMEALRLLVDLLERIS